MSKILVICGPTATGKTSIGLEIAKQFNGEIISADSRQVFVGRDIISGKDLPSNLKPQISKLKWRNIFLKYYVINGIKIWLYDVVEPGQPFNVSFWKECADLVIADMLSDGKLPIVVGGSGLYIKSLTHNLSEIVIPNNSELRLELENKDASYLFNYLKNLNPNKANSLNPSDRLNPRRLMRAIEIITSPLAPLHNYGEGNKRGEELQIGLTADKSFLYSRINQRVMDRITAGAASEDPELAADPVKWQNYEHGLARKQLTWFKKQSNIIWFDISTSNWQAKAEKVITNWYTNS